MERILKLRTKDGQEIEAVVIEDPRPEVDARLIKGVDDPLAPHFVLERSAFRNKERYIALESPQVIAKQYDPFFRSYNITDVAEPPVPPGYYVEIYRRCPTTRAVIDARVAAVVGLGYDIRYKPEVAWQGQHTTLKEPDTAALNRREKILRAIENCGALLSFQELLEAVWLDVELTGNGYIELTRDGEGEVDGFRHLRSVEARISKDYRVIYQIKNYQPVQAFAIYGTEATHLLVEPIRQKVGRGHRELWKVVGLHKTVSPDEVEKWGEEGREIRPTHEMLHLKHYSPADSIYGEPPILSAVEDYLGGLYARLFNISYFNAATVPRMMIIVKGGELNPNVEAAIKNFLREQEAMEALNQCLLVTVQEGMDVQIEKLSSEQLRDAGFIEYREQCDAGIRRAYRVPRSWVGEVEGGGRQQVTEVNQKFLQAVVRPHQVRLESAFNRVFRERLGVDDWVLVLHQHQVMDREVFARWAETLRRNGIATINELRAEIGLAPIPGGDIAHIMPMGMGVVPVQYLAALARALQEGRGDTLQIENPAEGLKPMGLAFLAEPRFEKQAAAAKNEWIRFLGWLQAAADSGTLDNIVSLVSPEPTRVDVSDEDEPSDAD